MVDLNGNLVAEERVRPAVLLTIAQVAEIVSLGQRTIWRLVSAGKFPAPVHVGSAARWRLCDLIEWCNELE